LYGTWVRPGPAVDPAGLTCRLGVGPSVSRQVDPEGLTCRLGVGQSVSRQVDPEGLTWCSEEWSHLVATHYRERLTAA